MALPLRLICFLYTICVCLKRSYQYENLALGKPVAVSKRYNNKDFDPSLAVDGDVSTDLLECTLTASGQREAWLTVDLGEVKNVASVSFVHGGCLNATAMDPKDSRVHPSLKGNGTFRFGPAANDVTLCPSSFTDRNAKIICLNWGYLPDNVTQYKVASDENLRFADDVYSCIGNEAKITDCVLYYLPCQNTGDQISISCKAGDTLAGFSVYVSDTTQWKSGTLCYQHDMAEPIDNSISVDCFTTGRYVTIYNSRTDSSHPFLSDFAYINICELNITGCDVGHYGENCSNCSIHCSNSTCHMKSGDCFDCKDGYTGSKCEKECLNGQYGARCSLQCGGCRNQETCDHVNGSCPFGCSPGWKGDKCIQYISSLNVAFISPTVILAIVLIGIVIFASKQTFCRSSKQNQAQNYELPITATSTNEYEKIQINCAGGGGGGGLTPPLQIVVR